MVKTSLHHFFYDLRGNVLFAGQIGCDKGQSKQLIVGHGISCTHLVRLQHQPFIDAALLQQFGMSALFAYSSAADDVYHIRLFNGRKPMRHYERRASAHKRLQPLLNKLLTLRIQSGSRLIQKQYRRIPDECPGDRDPLALPARQALAAFPDQRVVSIWKCHDKIMGISTFCRLNDLLIARILPPVPYIFFDACRKKPGILRHIGNVFPQFIRGKGG